MKNKSEPDIREIEEKILLGMSHETSLARNDASILWKQFMQKRNTIKNQLNSDLYSVQIYEPGFQMKDFTPTTKFIRWAAIEVSDINNIPDEMEELHLQGGLYAVFIHKGGVATFHETWKYIFLEWLPDSGYVLDQREHFEILGNKYLGNTNPESEEEIWVPVSAKC